MAGFKFICWNCRAQWEEELDDFVMSIIKQTAIEEDRSLGAQLWRLKTARLCATCDMKIMPSKQ